MALSPAEYVIRVFGGVRATARAIGRSPASVSKWRTGRTRRGTGGRVPSVAAAIILGVAKDRGLDITPYDLLCGRPVTKEIDKRSRREW